MYSPVPELNQLKEFDDSVDDWYAPGFELREFGGRASGYPRAEDRLRVFALATRSGSEYALWLRDDREDTGSLPVVFLGDEGGICLVARDVREFLRVVASGWTPCGDWEGLEYFADDEADDEAVELDGTGSAEAEEWDPCPHNGEFRSWLWRHFELEAVADPNETVAEAEGELWEEFAAWIGPLYPDVVESRVPSGG